jgi:hypothetical protein
VDVDGLSLRFMRPVFRRKKDSILHGMVSLGKRKGMYKKEYAWHTYSFEGMHTVSIFSAFLMR